MKKFILSFLLCLSLLVGMLVLGIFLIPNPILQESMLAAIPDKNEKLAAMESPKIVLIGGSNVSFGFDTERIAYELNMPAYNMGMLGSVGMDYMIKQTIPYIEENDIVVLIPEYQNFNSQMYFGKYYLTAVLFDISPENKHLVGMKQWWSLLPSITKYAASKWLGLPVFIKHYIGKPKELKSIHSRYCFNDFGDNYLHWELPSETIVAEPLNSNAANLNNESFEGFMAAKASIEERGGRIMLLPPSYFEGSFRNQQIAIRAVDERLAEIGLPFFVQPERYSFPVSYFFDTDYHLNKSGIDARTALVIEDIRAFKDK